MGGLGNQMFCYAAGRAVALRNGVESKLDTRGYPDSDQRIFELQRYQIAATAANDSELKRCDRRSLHKPVNRAIKKLQFWRSYGQTWNFRQRGFAFDPEFLKIGPDAYVEGLFQSEKFFSGYESVIRDELRLKEPLDAANSAMAGQMRSCESVSLHVRRTDYITNPNYAQVLACCDLSYYEKAIQLVLERTVSPAFFIFSDDLDWCRTHLNLNQPHVFVDLNGSEAPWFDLHLMSECKHHVVANSTFSWWGAWLAESEEQMVIAPRRWFSSGKFEDVDIIPERWQRI